MEKSKAYEEIVNLKTISLRMRLEENLNDEIGISEKIGLIKKLDDNDKSKFKKILRASLGYILLVETLLEAKENLKDGVTIDYYVDEYFKILKENALKQVKGEKNGKVNQRTIIKKTRQVQKAKNKFI